MKFGADDEARIDVKSEDNLRYWSEKLGASQDELRRMVDQVGSKVKDVRQHLFGGFKLGTCGLLSFGESTC